MNVREANIVNPQLKVLSMLHDCHRVCPYMEVQGEITLELLLVSDQDSITEDAPLAG